MPQVAFLRLGDIKGWYNEKGPLSAENKFIGPTYVPVYAFEHQAGASIDPKTGKPTKELSHRPFVITKRVDPTSPLLHQSYKKNAILDPFELRLYHIPLSGPNTHYFSIKLTEARVASIKMVKPSMTEPINGAGHEIEQVAFVYKKITWEAPDNVPIGQERGTAPNDTFEEDGSFHPDWIEEQAKTAVQKMFDLLSDRVKAAATAELIKEGVKVPEEN